MQIDQLFEFVYILIDKKQVTAKEMSEYFGVSTRTVYRWIDALSVSGVPIYSLKGRWKISGLVAKNTDWLEVDFAPWKLVFRGRPGTF